MHGDSTSKASSSQNNCLEILQKNRKLSLFITLLPSPDLLHFTLRRLLIIWLPLNFSVPVMQFACREELINAMISCFLCNIDIIVSVFLQNAQRIDMAHLRKLTLSRVIML